MDPVVPNPWRNAKKVSLIGYCDMGFGALSIGLSIITFIYALPLNREGNEFVHDFVTVTFMASLILHFAQIFEGVMLLNGSEMQNDPHEAVRLAKYWQLWSIFLMILLGTKLLFAFLYVQRTFLLAVYALFITLELPYRLYWRCTVAEFIDELETGFPLKSRYRPYLWIQ